MHDSEQEHSGITGCRVTYESTIFYNEANKFSIIVVKTNDPRIPLQACSDRYYGDRMLRFTAVGYELPRTKAVELELDGEWVESKYGYQLQVEQWQEIVPQTADGLLAYLGSGLIKGIGPKTAEDIVATFGPDTLNILDNEPEKLLQIRGITEGKLKDIEESYAEKHGDKLPENGMADIVCPDCGTRGKWTEPRDFNMMLRTHLGPVEDENSLHYLRPETAQGIFVDFKNVMTSSRKKPPFGIANMGKSFRNEITPGNFIFRTREFEQMEMEFFVKPGEDEAWHQYWIDARTQWYLDLGVKPENLRHYEHPKEKLAHYSKRTVDIEYKFGFQGSDWGELEGIANRTDFDLSAHAEHSGEDLSYFNQATGEKYVPYVIEPAAGLTRSLMCFLVDAYDVDEAPNTKGGVDKRTVLHLDPRLAPVKAAVLPLSKKPDLQSVAQKLAADLRQNEWMIDYDEAGAIGRRYRREDEIGTPLCVTVDFDTLDDQAVTIRERDTMQQERVSLDKVADYIAERIGEKRVSVPQMPVEMGGEAWPESVKIAEAGGLY